jgi:hypothetical protein
VGSLEALEGSSQILFDVELDELCEDADKMIKQVIYGN